MVQQVTSYELLEHEQCMRQVQRAGQRERTNDSKLCTTDDPHPPPRHTLGGGRGTSPATRAATPTPPHDTVTLPT